mmetsp:Transcript_9173/g.15882  ORF Transcript_9173/g.15882 Transcript_9173/m.15882 type:complete len:118 (-) Transcript_9173:103-456(-)
MVIGLVVAAQVSGIVEDESWQITTLHMGVSEWMADVDQTRPELPVLRHLWHFQGDAYPLVSLCGRMQDDTGLFYCGKRMEKVDKNHDGFCGPHNGPCCSQCFQLLGVAAGSVPLVQR